MEKQCYVYCNYKDTRGTYINSSMALLKVGNSKMIIYNKVFDNRARLAQDLATYKIPC